MKRPASSEQIDLEGCLPRSHVLDALYRANVDVSHLRDGMVRLEKDINLCVVYLDDPVGGLTVRELRRKFDLDLEFLLSNRLH